MPSVKITATIPEFLARKTGLEAGRGVSERLQELVMLGYMAEKEQKAEESTASLKEKSLE